MPESAPIPGPTVQVPLGFLGLVRSRLGRLPIDSGAADLVAAWDKVVGPLAQAAADAAQTPPPSPPEEVTHD